MRYKTLFRLLLKAIGVWLFAQGAAAAARSIASLFAYVALWLPQAATSQLPAFPRSMWGLPLLDAIVGPAVEIGFGLYLFFGGKWLVDLAIPGNRPYCPECGYDLTGAAANRCPECGTPFRPQDVAPGSTTSEADA